MVVPEYVAELGRHCGDEFLLTGVVARQPGTKDEASKREVPDQVPDSEAVARRVVCELG